MKSRRLGELGLREGHLQKVFDTALKNPGNTGSVITQLLERRLDNTIFRLGLAPSRSVARNLISHGHIMVNDRKHNISSYVVEIGDKLSVRPQSKDDASFKKLSETLKNYEAPVWLRLNKEKMEGESFPAERY